MLPGREYTPIDFAWMAWRWRWVIAVPLLAGVYVALIISSRLPNVYESEMLIQVVPQRVPDSYVRSTVTMRTGDRLAALTEQVTSRSELERLITEMNLYPELRTKLPMQDVVEQMRAHVKVDPTRGGNPGEPDSFFVRFSYSEPAVATKVTERLATLLIDVNARDRGNLAQATNNFLETQLDGARKRLEDQEEKIRRFREKNAGRLPTQLQYNMQALQNAQIRAQSLVESMAHDRDRRLLLERMFEDAQAEANVPPVAARPTTDPQETPAAAAARGTTTQQKLASAQQALAALQLRLQPGHPDVTTTKKLIATLEAQLAEETKTAEEARAAQQAKREGEKDDTPPEALGVVVADAARRDRLQQMRAEIESVDRQIAFKESEETKLRESIDNLQRRIEGVPETESEWTSLSRDYDTLQAAYRDLLSKSEAAKLAADLEERQIGEQFRIVDPPRTPLKPNGTNRVRINVAGAGIGLAIGLLFAALLELRDRTFQSGDDVSDVLKLPVIAMVPQVVTDAERRRSRLLKAVTALAATVAVLVAGYGFYVMQLWKFLV